MKEAGMTVGGFTSTLHRATNWVTEALDVAFEASTHGRRASRPWRRACATT